LTTARNVEVRVDDEDIPVSVTQNTQSVGAVKDGSERRVEYRAFVSQNADPGTYDLPVEIEYTYTNRMSKQDENSDGDFDHKRVTKHFEVPITVEDVAKFKVVDTESNARVGTTGNVKVTLRNVGTEIAKNAEVSLTTKSSSVTFGESESATRFVGDWETSQNKTVTYRVRTSPDADRQRFAFDARVNFNDKKGARRVGDTLTLGIMPQAKQSFDVESTAGDLNVGTTSTMQVTLENEGPGVAHDATVKVESSSSDVRFGRSGAATRYVGEWTPGTQKTISLATTISNSADTTRYALKATVSYADSEGDSERSTPVSFGITPDNDKRFEVSNVTSNLQAGKEGKISGTITNTGNETTKNTVLVFATNATTVTPLEHKRSVGDLSPGASASFTFPVEMSASVQAGGKQFAFRPQFETEAGKQRRGAKIVTRQVVGAGESPFAVELETDAVPKGKQSAIAVNVTNTGESTLENVAVKAFADDPITIDDSESFVDALAPGEAAQVKYSISTSKSAIEKDYPISFDVQYDDDNGDRLLAKTHHASVTVGTTGGLSLASLTSLTGGIGGLVAIVVAIGVSGLVVFNYLDD
jgi:hypothetical protein